MPCSETSRINGSLNSHLSLVLPAFYVSNWDSSPYRRLRYNDAGRQSNFAFYFFTLKFKGMKKKEVKKAKDAGSVQMPIVNPNAAGIDIGDTIHAVAVPPDREEKSVRIFGTMSQDLEEITRWLEKCGVDSVAMESTGVYWKPVFNYLIHRGFEVYLVNPQQLKNISGRKTDMSDAAWIQQMHSLGLLRSSYLPGDQQESLRTLVRHRRTLTRESSRFVLRMEKAMELMNLKLHTVISDLTGKTGRAIVEAILAGERNPRNFLPLVDSRIQATPEEIVKSLEGDWQDDQLFMLAENYRCYQFFKECIAKCDQAIESKLQTYAAVCHEGELPKSVEEPDKKKKRKKKNKNTPAFDIQSYLISILGVDTSAIFGISEISALEILAETGTDIKKWPDAKHFVSWLNICPNNKESGGKLKSSKLQKKRSNAASQAFRMAANSLGTSDNWLGDYFRRKKAKGGNIYAIIATANKLATIYYKMVSEKQPFSPLDLQKYREQRNNSKIAYLERKLESLKKQVA